MKQNELKLYVCRDLSNRRDDPDDMGPMAWELHRRRSRALHEDLNDPTYQVRGVVSDNRRVASEDRKRWGDCDDEAKTHEVIELAISVLAHPVVQAAVVPALTFVGVILAGVVQDLVKDAVVDVMSKLVVRMRGEHRAVQNFSIELPDGSKVAVGEDANVEIVLRQGKTFRFSYDASESELKAVAHDGC